MMLSRRLLCRLVALSNVVSFCFNVVSTNHVLKYSYSSCILHSATTARNPPPVLPPETVLKTVGGSKHYQCPDRFRISIRDAFVFIDNVRFAFAGKPSRPHDSAFPEHPYHAITNRSRI
jgi:hypothetical protein